MGLYEPRIAEDVPIAVTETDTDGTGTSTGDGGGGDESGGGEPTPTQNNCLFDDTPNRFGYRYQCKGFMQVNWSATIPGYSDQEGNLVVEFGASVPGDDYDKPLVMACCPLYSTDAWCAQPHHQACVVDALEQGCKSLGVNIAKIAKDTSDPAEREGLNKLAKDVNDKQKDCLKAFLYDTDVADISPSCDASENEVFDYNAAAQGASWSFNPSGIATNVEFGITSLEVSDLFPFDNQGIETCNSADDNDDIAFVESDPSAGSIWTVLEGGSVILHGPEFGGEPIEGSGELASLSSSCTGGGCSTASMSAEADGIRLESFLLQSAGPTDAGTSQSSLLIDNFRIQLYSAASAPISPNGVFEIETGDALFVLSAKSGGEARIANAWNASPIVFDEVRGNWSFGTFTIAYQDGNGDFWDLVVMPGEWARTP